MTSTKLLTQTIVFLILVVTFVSCGKRNKVELPFLGKHVFTETDTTFYQLPEYQFTKQDGTNFGAENLRGKPYIAYFFFTSCPSVCPRMTQGAKRVQRSLEGEKDGFNIVAFSIDPDRDSIEKLQSFSKEYDVDLQNWHFLRGLEKDIFKIGEKSFYVGINKNKEEPGGFLHSEKMILIDASGHIRGYYSGTDSHEVKKMIEALENLIKENKPKIDA